MSAESELHAALVGYSGVTSLVANRIYPYIASPKADLPLIVYERTSTEVHSTIHDSTPVAEKASVSASAWSRTRAQAEEIADAMQIAMSQTGIPVNRFGQFDQESDAHAVIVEFEIWQL